MNLDSNMKIEVNEPQNRVNTPLKVIMIRNFLGGIAWAVGITIGFSLFVAALKFLGNYIDLIPVVGTFISDIIDFVLSYNRNI